MKRRPTIKTLAEQAGVGTATVDRALNGRGQVSAAMRARIEEAAREIGYPLPQNRGCLAQDSLPKIGLGFVLHKSSQAFYQQFAREIEAACAGYGPAKLAPHIHFAPSQAPADFRAAITEAAAHGQAVAATAINHPLLTEQARKLRAEGVPLFALLNDFAGQYGLGYFGLDNLRVGRIAGWMMATRLQTAGRVSLMVGGARWHGQGLRETGFRSALREYAPGVTLGETAVNLETRQVAYEATLDLLNRHADLAGLYVAGGGMEGAIAALREARPPGKLTLIVNELTDESRTALVDGYVTMIIATPLAELCRQLVRSMAEAVMSGNAVEPRSHVFAPRLFLPESV